MPVPGIHKTCIVIQKRNVAVRGCAAEHCRSKEIYIHGYTYKALWHTSYSLNGIQTAVDFVFYQFQISAVTAFVQNVA